MSNVQVENVTSTTVLSPVSLRGAVALGVLTAATVLLPPICHMAGVPVRWVLPMHWPVILAALVYGWRGGAIVGILAPLVSFALSGYPLPPKIPPMTVELLAYGALIGVLRERFRLNGFLSTALGLALGRVIFIMAIVLTAANEVPFGDYLIAAMLPGLGAAVLQILVLPPTAAQWVSRSGK